MNKIMNMQIELQDKLSKLNASVANPSDLFDDNDTTAGDLYDYIRNNQFFLNEEITEIMEALGDGSRDIHKQWSANYGPLRSRMLHNDFSGKDLAKLKEEATDALCFMLNICIALGINADNITPEYKKVFHKNIKRIEARVGQNK